MIQTIFRLVIQPNLILGVFLELVHHTVSTFTGSTAQTKIETLSVFSIGKWVSLFGKAYLTYLYWYLISKCERKCCLRCSLFINTVLNRDQTMYYTLTNEHCKEWYFHKYFPTKLKSLTIQKFEYHSYPFIHLPPTPNKNHAVLPANVNDNCVKIRCH